MSRKFLTIENMHEIAKIKNGKCLSTEYITNNHKLTWQCSKGHIWQAKPRLIKNAGRWCNECRKISIENLHQAAVKNGGSLMSNVYTNINAKYIWKCAKEHTWEAAGTSIIYNKSWCPYCSSYMSENICRLFFEKIFSKKFKKCRPKILTSNNNGRLELDGYCEELGLAFEHNGMQHYENGHFNNDLNIKNRDKQKIDLCKKHGIKLVIIPQLFKVIKIENLQNFIYDECKRLNINTLYYKINIDDIKRNIGDFRANVFELENIKNIAVKNNGVCLSNIYINRNTKMKFRCENNHEWETMPCVIVKGGWCKKCSYKKSIKYTIKDIQNIAISRKGKCLSTEYTNYDTKLQFECKNKHVWEASFDSLKSGRWCPKCRDVYINAGLML